jgi:hypothetical protein
VVLETCPKSFVTAESESLVEEFLLRRQLGGLNVGRLSAKQAEAFAILEQEFAAETKNVEQNTTTGF